MPRFFISDEVLLSESPTKSFIITGDDAHHISRSLRMRVGEALTLCDGCGTDYNCEIADISDRQVTLNVLSEEKNLTEPPYFATVYQALVKGDKFDTVIQKSVECGASKIVPLITSRCTVKFDPSDYKKKCDRYSRIAEEAAKQCGRGIVPKVELPMPFKNLAESVTEERTLLFCYEKGNVPLREVIEASDGKNFDIIIGPEGGFSEEEANTLSSLGAKPVSLGPRILRTESAAPFVLAALSYALEK